MAARTSQQSGNFTASATWGGTPADGDTFTIAAGHSVTSSTVDMPTNGYGYNQCNLNNLLQYLKFSHYHHK